MLAHGYFRSSLVLLTWDDQGLAAHDEDDLHRSKLSEAQFPPLLQRNAKLDDEDSTEETDADCRRDGRCALKSHEVRRILEGDDVDRVLDADRKAKGHRK